MALAARGCGQASRQRRARRLGQGDVLTGRSRSAGGAAMAICVSRGLANGCAGRFGSGSQDAGRAERRTGSECLALRGLREFGHGEGCYAVIGLPPCLGTLGGEEEKRRRSGVRKNGRDDAECTWRREEKKDGVHKL